MARITVDDCLKRIPNRFQLTLTATYRARQLSSGASPLVEPNRDKFTVIALREISVGKIGVDVSANPDARAFYESAGFVDAGMADTRFGPAPRMALEIRETDPPPP